MYYRLNDNYALRAWKFVNNVIYHRYLPNPICVDKETFELLRLCDGEHDIEESDALKNLTEKDVIALCLICQLNKNEYPLCSAGLFIYTFGTTVSYG